MEQLSFGDWLRRRRKALDLTREALADRVGCSAATIRKIEAEERRPSVQIAERLAVIFGIPREQWSDFFSFARGAWTASPSSAGREEPWRASVRPSRSNLPARATSLVGREADITGICDRLRRVDVRLVTLTGPPGIGKTRLSLEVGRASLGDFPDGVFFVALAALDDPSLVPPAVVRALGFVEAGNRSASQQLVEGIGERRMLLILDNCEHLVEAVASLASSLLSACPRLQVLATSRESLRIPGEWLYPVPTLAVPEGPVSTEGPGSRFGALRLFEERARAVRPDFVLNANNLQTVSAICAKLDGLPLAIELLAARIRLLSPESLLARMDERFILSADGMRAVPARQKTLEGAIAWSYNLLSPAEQALHAGLSVFSGGFTLEAAESVFAPALPDRPVSDLVLSLLDKSLLQRVVDDRGNGRFHMLVTIRQFALERLRSTGREAQARDAHLAYFLDLAERADEHIHGPDQLAWIDRLEEEHGNLRAALDWCLSGSKAGSALHLLGAVSWSWELRGHYREKRIFFERVRLLPGVADHPGLYARLLNHMGRQSWVLSEFEEARALLDRSRQLWLGLGAGGEPGLAEALILLGMVARSSQGDNRTAQALYEHGLDLYNRHADTWGVAFTMLNLGWIADDRNEDARALALFEQSRELFRRLGDPGAWPGSRSSWDSSS